MPPKPDQTPEKQIDTNPFGVFINLEVNKYVLQLVSIEVDASKGPLVHSRSSTQEIAAAPANVKGGKGAPVASDGPLPLPRMHISLDYSNVFAAVNGNQSDPEPAQLATPPAAGEKTIVDCSYEVKDTVAFRIDESLAALSQLINTKVLVRVHASDVVGAPVIATAVLDMQPFACGEGRFQFQSVKLVAVEATGAPRLISGLLSDVHVHLTARRRLETSEKPQTDVIKPEVFSFVTPQDVEDGANVIEVEIGGLQPLPAGLQAAADLVCGKDGQQGKVTFMAGLSLPAPAPVIAIQGRISSGQVVFDGPMRFLLSAEGAEALRTYLEAGNLLTVEIARYVTCADTLVDNAWNSYHGLATIQNSLSLIEEDCKILTCEPSELMPWQGIGQLSCLPPFVEKPSSGKAKPIEPDAASYGPSAWSKSSFCNIKMSLLVSPLVPKWQAPFAPPKSIIDLIPTRDLNPEPPPLDPSGDFKAQVQAALKALAQAYQEHGPSATSKGYLPVPVKHKSLIFDLNRSGTYLNLRESFKPAMERIVREHLSGGRDIISQPDVMVPHYSQLYESLMDLVHLQLSSVGNTIPQPKPPQVLSADKSEQLLELANEYEDHGSWLLGSKETVPVKSQELLKRAQDLHRKRLIDCNNAEIWIDAASFSIRVGDLTSGTSALRSALEINPRSKDALLKMTLSSLELLLSSNAAGDSGHYEAALAAAYALVGLSNEEDEAVNWANLALTFTQDPNLPGVSRKNSPWMQSRQKLSTLERKALAAGQSPESANGFFQLWASARALRLPLVSREIRALVPILQQSSKALEVRSASASLETSYLLLTGTAAQTEELSKVINETKKLLRRLSSSHASDLFTTLIVQADVYRRMGLLDESILSLQKARRYAVGDSRVLLATNLRLADTYMIRSGPQFFLYARSTLLTSAAEEMRVRQSPLCWCLVGYSCLEDSAFASKSFKEANNIDPELSASWIYLALIEAKSQRWDEASSALARSFQLGAFGVEALNLIAAQFESAGRWRQAAEILEEVMSLQGENEDTKRRLRQCHLLAKNARKVLDLNGDDDVDHQALALPVDEF